MQRLLVSVRGPREALEAVRGGAQIADVEYPVSALGTPYPLNIAAVRSKLTEEGFGEVSVSTNIGELQGVRAAACQAALGVAVAGADLIKFGLAEQPLAAAAYLGRSVVRTVQELGPKSRRLYPAVFVDDDLRRFFDPLSEARALLAETHADGILLDTFNKLIGRGILDYVSLAEISALVADIHADGRELWVAGSLTLGELPGLWDVGVDVICVRGAACEARGSSGRFGEVSSSAVAKLVATIPA